MKYHVIAIEREYASGGLEVAQKLAKRLGVPCYGREILEMASEKMAVPAARLADVEESVTGLLSSTLGMLANMPYSLTDALPKAEKLALVEGDIIRQCACNPCVLVGRGAAGLLKDDERVLKVFIQSDRKARMDRAVARYQIPRQQAEATLRRFDNRRAAYFKYATGIEWRDAGLYHLCLNSGKLGVEQVVELLSHVERSEGT